MKSELHIHVVATIYEEVTVRSKSLANSLIAAWIPIAMSGSWLASCGGNEGSVGNLDSELQIETEDPGVDDPEEPEEGCGNQGPCPEDQLCVSEASMCVPDCRVTGFCPVDDLTCNEQTGLCERSERPKESVACTGEEPTCPEGMVCHVLAGVCRLDCRVTGFCPADDLTCNEQTGLCQGDGPPACDQDDPTCPPNAVCNLDRGVCVPDCRISDHCGNFGLYCDEQIGTCVS